LSALEHKLAPGDSRLQQALGNEARLLESPRRPKEAAALRKAIGQTAQGFRTGD